MEKILNHNIKCNLEDLMWEKRIPSINWLSEKTKISRDTLTRLKKNEVDGIRMGTLETLCTFLDCEIHELFEIQK